MAPTRKRRAGRYQVPANPAMTVVVPDVPAKGRGPANYLHETRLLLWNRQLMRRDAREYMEALLAPIENRLRRQALLVEGANEIVELGDGWDGPGSFGAASETISSLDAAMPALLKIDRHLETFVLNRDGSIALRWLLEDDEGRLTVWLVGSQMYLRAEDFSGPPDDAVVPFSARTLAAFVRSGSLPKA